LANPVAGFPNAYVAGLPHRKTVRNPDGAGRPTPHDRGMSFTRLIGAGRETAVRA
jgi:hypothetical protein